jgi:hypothetical protein
MSQFPTETACHEAGHVVVAKLLGMPTASIVLKPRSGVLGESDVHVGRASALDRAAIMFAGWYAQHRAYPGCDKGGAWSDLAAVKLCLDGHPKGTRERIRQRVKKLLAKNWVAVLALATEIDRRGALYSDDLTALGYFWEAPEPEWLRID